VLHIDRGSLNTLLLPEAKEQSVVLCRMNSVEEQDRNAKRRELQAERFAAYVLMPRDLLREACADMDLCQWRNLYRLKDEFHVTITALTKRLKELHLVTVTSDRRLVPYQDKLATQMHSLWEYFFERNVEWMCQHNTTGQAQVHLLGYLSRRGSHSYWRQKY